MNCECCRETRFATREFVTVVGGVRAVATLCPRCRGAGHAIELCRGCAGHGVRIAVWYCARVAHAAEYHAGLVERRVNAPDDPTPDNGQRYLGKLVIP